MGACYSAPAPLHLHVQHNPLISDGSRYSADPAPLAVGDTFYVLAGRDEAAATGGFDMRSWQLFATKDPSGREWDLFPDILRPERVFGWATKNGAYAGQIVQGPDRRFYLYAPVIERECRAHDCFGIGIAAADSPLGPWQDVHPQGPIISQKLPVPNTIENIDPTVLVDDDNRVYLYWGTFNQLRGIELQRDMTTPIGRPITVTSLTGFFEAPWLMKRGGTYYMIYAANNAGPDSPCTTSIYHACQAWGTAPSPLGPWTYRGVMLDPVTSATSHAGVAAFKGKWYITYHNADAVGGDHFHRSVAVDELQWDDSVSPPAIRKVLQTRAGNDKAPSHNRALAARIMASNHPVPLQYRLGALNDGREPTSPLPPDMWANWTGRNNMRRAWILYQWDHPQRLSSSYIHFWADHPPGAGEGVAFPQAWHLEYWDGADWQAVRTKDRYSLDPEGLSRVAFDAINSRCLRAVFDASTNGKGYAAVGVLEWQAKSPEAFIPPAMPPRTRATVDCKQH